MSNAVKSLSAPLAQCVKHRSSIRDLRTKTVTVKELGFRLKYQIVSKLSTEKSIYIGHAINNKLDKQLRSKPYS